jgi:hypothetical protein
VKFSVDGLILENEFSAQFEVKKSEERLDDSPEVRFDDSCEIRFDLCKIRF